MPHVEQGALPFEPLPSFSTRDLSQLVFSWVGSEANEYLRELDGSSGLDFQSRMTQRQTLFTSVSSIASESLEQSEVFIASDLSHADTLESSATSMPSFEKCVGEKSGMLAPVEPTQPPENKRHIEPANEQAIHPSKRPRFEPVVVILGARYRNGTLIACERRLVSLKGLESTWPEFSGSSSELDQLKGTLNSFSFNVLELSDNDLTVVLGELFQQAIQIFFFMIPSNTIL